MFPEEKMKKSKNVKFPNRRFMARLIIADARINKEHNSFSQ
jgi:hypothetical protein